MDTNLNTPWKDRILLTRMALKQIVPYFAKLIGCSPDTLRKLERGQVEPNIKVIRVIRLLESKYSTEIAIARKQAKKYNCLS